jgi:hypothetical protein
MKAAPVIKAALTAACAVCAFTCAAGDARMETLAEAPLTDREALAYKLTPTYYSTTHTAPAWDFNLRANLGASTAWVGYYRRAEEFQQLRLGYERTLELPYARVVPSFQYATRGFLGGSLTAEIGGDYFLLAGLGRTNLRDYFNLNFDPNDSILIGLGTRAWKSTTLSAFQIRDDRLGTGQRVTHVVARFKPDDRTRWTLDAFHKEGRSTDSDAWVRGTGVSVTYDFDRYFWRVAADPHVNFTSNHMIRAAIGMRF